MSKDYKSIVLLIKLYRQIQGAKNIKEPIYKTLKKFAVCALTLIIRLSNFQKETGFVHYSKLFWHYGSKLNFSENGVRKILKRTPRLPRRQMSSYLGA